ncbi:hypothetical protein [Radiobacillus sp. PE A8.2]|uniref:hypothetical protein n=1 Tax=Radiobacillus sp. PE A8.2 TaxID=3380349 RepID=UPI0038903066
MKKVMVLFAIAIITFVSVLLFDLSTKTLEGTVTDVDDNNQAFTTDCPVIKFSRNGRDDIGYLCHVQINQDTTISNNDGETLSLEQVHEGASVSIVLARRQFITAGNRSMIAKEIILLREEN